MKLYSTKNPEYKVSIREAVLQSLPPDNGLYMPEYVPQLDQHLIQKLDHYSFGEIAYEITKLYFDKEIESSTLRSIVDDAINFPAPLNTIDHKISILELFHGPTLAFKDFGARFMARIMNHFWDHPHKKLHILVATSGDTGGAVAAGFFGLDNIQVTILFPKGKVSKLQEAQLTSWGHNIQAIEVDDDFDTCQQMVKEAFLDKELNHSLQLSSANSINIARLIPQTFYYFEAAKQLPLGQELNFSVPSGNFGNLTAGLLAKRMGLPIHKMIAATNINDVVPKYLKTGDFSPAKSHATLSNAMDIGNPSNFARIQNLYGSTWNKIKENIVGYAYTDEETIQEIINIHLKCGYVLDPHTAIGVLAAKEYKAHHEDSREIIVLSTAHPIKFQSEIESHINFSIPYPAKIHHFLNKPSEKISIQGNLNSFKEVLLANS